MRKIVAGFVLGVLAWSFVAPAALALATDTTSACCRRNGKHHCFSPSGMADSADGRTSLRASSPKCPYRSQIATRTAVSQQQASANLTFQLPSASSVPTGNDLPRDSRLDGADPQRGPPV